MDEIKEIRENLVVNNLQRINEILNAKCFDLCCKNPTGHLSEVEKKCLSNCHDNFFQAINVVAETINKLNAQAQQR